MNSTEVRPSPSWFRVLAVWFRQELLLLLREPVAIFFSLAFPIIIYVFIGIPYAERLLGNGVRFIDAMVPGLIGTVSANLLLMGLPIYLAELRTKQVARRYRAIPLPGSIFATAVLLAMLVLVICAYGVILTLIQVRHGLRAELLSPTFIVLNIGLLAWLSAVGFLLGTLPLGSRTIQALSGVIFFVMFFGSGAAAPLDALPQTLQDILAWNPLKQWFDVLTGVYSSQAVPSGQWLKLLVALPLTVVSVVLGLRFWRRS